MAFKILIENPAPGGNAFTGPNRARRFVRDGLAVFVGERAIRFLDQRPRRTSAIAETAAAKITRCDGGQYDRVNRVFTKELPRVPVVNPAKMIRQEKSSRNWSFAAGVKRTMRRDHTRAEVAAMRKSA